MKKIVLSCIVILNTIAIQAQNSVNASSGEASGSDGTVSYTVGQTFYQTHSGTTGTEAQGVQQPYEISVSSGIETLNISLNLSVFPNPVSTVLKLKIDDFGKEKLTFKLLDLNGKLLENKAIFAETTDILMGDLVPAIYFLRVIGENNEIKTFKIIKN